MGWLLACSRHLPAGNINKAKLAVNKPLSRESPSWECVQMPFIMHFVASELCLLISVVFCSDSSCLPLNANAATFDYHVQDISFLCCPCCQPVRLHAHQVLLLNEQRSLTSFLGTVNIMSDMVCPTCAQQQSTTNVLRIIYVMHTLLTSLFTVRHTVFESPYCVEQRTDLRKAMPGYCDNDFLRGVIMTPPCNIRV